MGRGTLLSMSTASALLRGLLRLVTYTAPSHPTQCYQKAVQNSMLQVQRQWQLATTCIAYMESGMQQKSADTTIGPRPCDGMYRPAVRLLNT